MTAERGLDTPDEAEDQYGDLQARYQAVRQQSTQLCEPCEIEDYGVQPMEDASPPKWHLAHTSWFFETFILKEQQSGYQPYHPLFEYLFNSYYNGVGKPFPRPQRGFLSRPTVAQVLDYRRSVDEAMQKLLSQPCSEAVLAQVDLGLQHEQQHQELLLTDLKYNFGHNPLYPVYGGGPQTNTEIAEPGTARFVTYEGGIIEVGAGSGFCFDNELPRHQVLLQPFQLSNRLVTNAEYLAFVNDGGYTRPELWLSEGWSTVQAQQWQGPLYWRNLNNQWFEYRLDGLHPLAPELPVVHVSGHEAFAFANWKGARLPTEYEWEHAAASQAVTGSFVESRHFHPTALHNAASSANKLHQLFGEVWQWTASSYGPYPGYKPLPGKLGEYNGKFMSSQWVLRGGSCATPRDHIRVSYRNFFYPPDRWQFSGIRLAQDVQ